MKMRKFLAQTLGVICLLSCFGGCGTSSDTQTPTGGGTSQNPQNGASNPIVHLNDFEGHNELSLLSMYAAFGKVELNKEEEFIYSGKGSAKLSVTHNPYVGGTGNPRLEQAMSFSLDGSNYEDFYNTTALTLQVYNAQNFVCRMGVQLLYSSGSEATAWFDLKPNAWNSLRYDVLNELIPIVVNTRLGTTSKPVKKVRFIFERPTEKENIFYWDEFLLYKTETSSMEDYKFTLAENEIASFDYYWQASYCTGGANSMEAEPKLSWAQLPDFPERKGMLKCELPRGNNASPYIEIGNALCSKIDFTKFDGKDGKDKYELCFDIYVENPENANLKAFTFYFDSFSYTVQLSGFKFDLEEGWNTVRVPFDRIVNNIHTASDPTYAITRNPKFRFTYLSQKMPITLYLDNMRMEKIV